MIQLLQNRFEGTLTSWPLIISSASLLGTSYIAILSNWPKHPCRWIWCGGSCGSCSYLHARLPSSAWIHCVAADCVIPRRVSAKVVVSQSHVGLALGSVVVRMRSLARPHLASFAAQSSGLAPTVSLSVSLNDFWSTRVRCCCSSCCCPLCSLTRPYTITTKSGTAAIIVESPSPIMSPTTPIGGAPHRLCTTRKVASTAIHSQTSSDCITRFLSPREFHQSSLLSAIAVHLTRARIRKLCRCYNKTLALTIISMITVILRTRLDPAVTFVVVSVATIPFLQSLLHYCHGSRFICNTENTQEKQFHTRVIN